MRVADHQAVEFGEERGVGEDFLGEEFFLGATDHREFFMRVHIGAAVGGKMFSTTEDATGPHGAIEDAGFGDDFLGIAPIAAAFERVVRRIVVGNIEDRAEIEIEAELKRLKMIREAVISGKGLMNANRRPSGWWLPLVSPDGTWFKETMRTAECYWEPMI